MAAESLEREIRDLRALLFSERDPEGRGFAPLADALRQAGDLGQALELVREGVKRLPDFATGHVVSGWVHRARGDEQEAERAFRRVLELDGENVSALRGLGFLLADRGADGEALDVFRHLDELAPGDLEVRARLLELGEREDVPIPDVDAAGQGRPIVAVASLAPEGAERPVAPIAALAPSTGSAGVGAPGASEAAGAAGDGGAPPRPEVEVGALAPDDDAPEEPDVVDVGEPERAGERPEVEIAALAPDPPGAGAVAEFATPAEEAEPGKVDPSRAGTPEAAAGSGEVVPLPTPSPPDAAGPGLDPEPPGPWTRTMAELYVRQGFPDRAVRIYRRLAERFPEDGELRDRLAELEAGGAAGAPPPAAEAVTADARPRRAGGGTAAATEEERDADLEDLARHMAAGPLQAEPPEGPFAWGGADDPEEEEEEADVVRGAPVSEYFRALLAWSPSGADSLEAPGEGGGPDPADGTGERPPPTEGP